VSEKSIGQSTLSIEIRRVVAIGSSSLDLLSTEDDGNY
jgi:hypothetical protein